MKALALTDLLLRDKQVLPVGKKLGSSMAGAYLIWTPFLVLLSTAIPSFGKGFLERMVEMLSVPVGGGVEEEDPVKEGMCGWVLHILTSAEWQTARTSLQGGKMLEEVLGLCFTTPTFWTLKLAEDLLRQSKLAEKAPWMAILDAARSEGGDEEEQERALPPKPVNVPEEMEIDTIDTGNPISGGVDGKKIRGPQKYAGLWRARPIGWIPPRCDVDL